MKNSITTILCSISLLILSNPIVFADNFCLSNPKKISTLPGNEINSFWIDDNTICFQHNYLSNNNLYIYNLQNDSLKLLFNGNFQNPVLHPDKENIVFDMEKDSISFIYKINIKTGKIKPLFNRKIQSKNASFSESGRQVYFSGFDETEGCWEIYSYDFIYDNINKLTTNRLGSDDPKVSKNGKDILYCKNNPFTGKKYLKIINWYGEQTDNFSQLEGYTPSWGNSGLKIYFVSGDSCLYSVWKNSTHLEKLTSDKDKVLFPAISPNGNQIAISILDKDNYNICVFNIW